MRVFLTASGLNAINVLLAVLLALVLSPFILNAVGDRLYGVFVLVSSFAGWFSLLDFGIGTAVSRFITVHYTKNDGPAANETANSALYLFLLTGFICFLLSLAVMGGVRFFSPAMPDLPTFSKVLFFFGLAFMVNFPTNVCEGIILGVMRHDLNAARAILFRLLGALGVWLAILCGGKVVAISVVTLVVNSINFIIVFLMARHVMPEFQPGLRFFRKERILEMFRYSMPVFFTQVGETVLNRSGMIILSVMVALEAVTPYSLVIVSLAGYSTILFQALTNWQTNWFTRLDTLNDEDRFRNSRRFIFKLSLLLTLFIAFGYLGWGQAFIIRWIGEKYLIAWPGLVLTMGYFVFCYSLSATCWRILLAKGRLRCYAVLTQVHSLISVLLGILFVFCGYGITGLAAASLLPGLVIHSILIPVYTCRITGDSVWRFYRGNLTTFLTGLLALVPVAVITWYYAAPSYGRLFPLGIIGLLTYFPLAFLFSFSTEERKLFLNFIKRHEK